MCAWVVTNPARGLARNSTSCRRLAMAGIAGHGGRDAAAACRGLDRLPRRSRGEPETFTPGGRPRSPTRCWSTSPPAPPAKPKLVQHTQQSYPVGHLSTMYWLGLKKGDVHWTVSSPGWAKHAWSCFFAPFNAQACVFIYNYARFNGPAILQVLVNHGVQTLCAPPTVWRMLILEDLKAWPVKLRELISPASR
jgi:acetyl-CoA synthetase